MDILLHKHQLAASEKCTDILSSNHGCINLSPPGAGKTILTLWLAQQFSLKVLVICPSTLIAQWRDEASKYGSDLLDIISFSTLVGKKNSKLSHKYLNRVGDEYSVTSKYKRLVSRGLLVVIDEFRLILGKDSLARKACNEIIKYIYSSDTCSRFTLLSGLPVEKEVEVLVLLDLLGYIEIKGKNKRGNTLESYREELVQLTNRLGYTIKRNDSLLQVVSTVILESISFSCPLPSDMTELDIANAFISLSEEETQIYRRYMKTLSRVSEEGYEYTHIQEALQGIETVKLRTLKVLTEFYTRKNSSGKVLIFLKFNDNIQKLTELFKETRLAVRVMTGKDTTLSERQSIISKFNDTSSVNVLIANVAITSMGLNLHDTYGKYPRLVLITSNYSLSTIYQAYHRAYRTGTKSKVTVRVIYTYGETDIPIYRSIKSKSDTAKQFTEKHSKEEILPGDFPNKYYDFSKEVSI